MRCKVLCSFLCSLILGAPGFGQGQKPAPKTYVLKAARLFDGKSNAVVTPGLVVVADGKITAYESPALLNTDVRSLSLKDDPIGKRTYEAAQNAPEGSVVTIDYKLPKPGTTVPAPKQTVEARVGKQSCGVTYFK